MNTPHVTQNQVTQNVASPLPVQDVEGEKSDDGFGDFGDNNDKDERETQDEGWATSFDEPKATIEPVNEATSAVIDQTDT